MFPFLKQHYLIDIFPDDFVDVHSHILPNLDDGPTTIDESIELIGRLHNLGISKTVCTPHIMEGIWENTAELITIRVQQMRHQLEQATMHDVGIAAAAEYMLDDNFRSLLGKQQLMTFGSQMVLVEIHFFSPPMDLYELLFQMQLMNYKPVIAHPERYTFLIDNTAEIQKLKQAGCLLQLNLLSVGGFYGKKVQQLARELLKNGMYDLIGTDTHNLAHLNDLQKIKGTRLLRLLRPVIYNNVALLSDGF